MLQRPPTRTNRTDKDDERRSMCRYAAAKGHIVIGWWIGPDFKAVEVALRDVSLSGVSAVTRTPPPRSAPIWLRLTNPAHPDWVEARVIAVATRFWRPALVRMKFPELCPFDFFKAAIRGMVPQHKTEEFVQAGQNRQYWGGRYWD